MISLRPASVVALLAAAAVTPPPAAADSILDGYMDHGRLTAAVDALARDHEHCWMNVIGTSTEGRDIYQLTLAHDRAQAGQRPAILLVAGLDGRHLVGTETVVRLARRLLAEHDDLLGRYTFYVIPRANPDGAEASFAVPRSGFVGNFTEVDDDRDGAVNEDGPQDLNGDGFITSMRRPDPPLDDEPGFVEDPLEPRLLKKPDANKGEVAKYSLYTEGLDDDGDGLIAEDGPGSVDPDRNFMHLWPEYERNAGAVPLSEPEAMAIATFVLEHGNIVAAVTYGRHDNLVNDPDTKGRDATGRGPKEVDAGDAAIYKELGKIYKEITGQKRAPKTESAGSLHAWLYAQRGVPSFATVVWGRPDPSEPPEEEKDAQHAEDAEPKPETAPETPAEGEPAAEGDPVTGMWSGKANVPEMGEMDVTLDLKRADDDSVTGTFNAMMGSAPVTGTYNPGSGALSLSAAFGPEMTIPMELVLEGDDLRGTATGPEGEAVDITGKRISSDEQSGADGGKKDKPSDEEAVAWLAYSDRDRGGAGFVAWEPFDHPTLGPVEIGGFVPGFRMNPPAGELDALAEKQAEFLVALAGKLPDLKVQGPTVTQLAPGLYEVRLGISNAGYLPTKTAMARKARAIPPTVVRISTPIEQVVAGDRVSRVWGLDGSGGRSVHHWIVRVEDGSELAIDLINPQLGDRTITFTAEATP